MRAGTLSTTVMGIAVPLAEGRGVQEAGLGGEYRAPGSGSSSPKQRMSQQTAEVLYRARAGDFFFVGRAATPQAAMRHKSASQPPWGQAGLDALLSDLGLSGQSLWRGDVYLKTNNQTGSGWLLPQR